jgi:hypothetical protein
MSIARWGSYQDSNGKLVKNMTEEEVKDFVCDTLDKL